jgi:Plavaka transposase
MWMPTERYNASSICRQASGGGVPRYVPFVNSLGLFHINQVFQRELEAQTGKNNCTIVPVLISSDKTQLTVFRGKTAYPVYMTIGNLPKHIRRKPSRQGQVLLAYLPTSKLGHISNKSARRRTLANLFHVCMKYILKPLETAGVEGVHLTSGDGIVRCCYPIYATFVGDYPEQLLVTCIKTGECPTCPAPRDDLGNPDSVGPPRELDRILEAFDAISQGLTVFARSCKEVGVKPIQHPFWEDLPFVNIYQSIAPDVLHQLYQGVIKHLIAWLRTICGDAEIDARCRRLPPNHNIRIFANGISHLTRVTGTEHDQISRFLLGLIIDIRLPNNMASARLVRAVRGLMDFLYLAKYPVHTAETLDILDDALKSFHDNKGVFVDLGVRAHFNIPKLHFTGHYRQFIERFGTTDNYNTEYTERLHIDLAKDAYRSTNFKDEYPQMTLWLERHEKVLRHHRYVQHQLRVSESAQHDVSGLPTGTKPPCLPACLVYPRQLVMAKHPSARGVSLDSLRDDYGAQFFEAALARFVAQYQNPEYTKAQVEAASLSVHIPFRKLSVYHRIKFVSSDPYSINSLQTVVDSIHAQPACLDKHGKGVPGRFDTGLITYKDGAIHGVSGVCGSSVTRVQVRSVLILSGHCVGRIRVIFTLPADTLRRWFSTGHKPAEYLAYVEWFTPFKRSPEPNHLLYKISKHLVRGEQQASVVPVELIRQSVHLLPKFGPVAPEEWKSSNVLDLCSTFYVNTFSERLSYSSLY